MRKGQIMTAEQRQKISNAHKKLTKPWLGQYIRTEKHRQEAATRARGNTYCKGRIMTPELKEKIRLSQPTLGKKVPYKARPSRQGKPTWNKGIPMREETKKKQSLLRTGTKAPWMKGNKHGLGNRGHRDFAGKDSPHWIANRAEIIGRHNRKFHDPDYKHWRLEVYKRDGFKCKIDDSNCSGRLEAHHILVWKEYPNLRYEVSNGITLCHYHHPRTRVGEKKLVTHFQSLIS